MRKLMLLAALALGLGAFSAKGAVLFPSVFQPIRSGIVEEIQSITNEPPRTREENRRLRLLNQARRSIDRAGRATLFGDVQILAGLNNTLSRLFPDGEFTPLIETAILDYRDLMTEAAIDLNDRVGRMPPSGGTVQASNTVADVVDELAALDIASGAGSSMQILTRSATRLRSVEGLLTRTGPGGGRVNRMTAIVDGRRFSATQNGVSGIYNGGSFFLTISGREGVGAGTANRAIQLFLSDVRPGTSTHSLGAAGTGNYAIYSERTATNSIGISSITGNATVTLDAINNTVTGRFNFTAQDVFSGVGPVRVSGGDFLLQLTASP